MLSIRVIATGLLAMQMGTAVAQQSPAPRQRAPSAYPEPMADLAAQRQLAQVTALLDQFQDSLMGPVMNVLRNKPEAAVKWATEAARNKDPMGYYVLGVAYREGLGLTKSLRGASSYFSAAADSRQIESAYLQAARDVLSAAQSDTLDSELRKAGTYIWYGSQYAQNETWKLRYRGLNTAFLAAQDQMRAESERARNQQSTSTDLGMVFLALFAAAIVVGANTPGGYSAPNTSGSGAQDWAAQERDNAAFARGIEEIGRGEWNVCGFGCKR